MGGNYWSCGGCAARPPRNAKCCAPVNNVFQQTLLRNAKAHATKAAPSGDTVQMKDAFVDLATSDAKYDVEIAEIEVKYAADCVEERGSERSSLQTQAKVVIEEMRLAGFGGDA